MESEIRNLIKLRGENFHNQNYDFSSIDFNFIGKVDSLQDLEEFPSKSLFIWHVGEGITTLNNFEIERWSVDAPSGNHLIISERFIDDNLNTDNYRKNKIFFWGPNELSQWFGRAILNKEIQLSVIKDDKIDDEISEINLNKSTDSSILTLKNNIEISTWLSNKGLSGVTYSPILLSSKLWEVDGELIGPDGSVEKKRWKIIEDPWENNFTMFSNVEVLPISPSLRIFEPNIDFWKDKSQIIDIIAPLINEKRQGKPKNAGLFTQSMVLQNWNFKTDSCNLYYKKILIPAWILNTENRQLIHGISGKTLSA
ncbi:MAG: hypothetical protein ACPG68_01825 [Candidatus Thalassarchaeaceae archaeon]|jgi:hypothetical protein